MTQRTCVLCGKPFSAIAAVDHCPACAGGKTPDRRRRKGRNYFDRHPTLKVEDVSGRSIARTAGLLVVGWAIVLGGVYLGGVYLWMLVPFLPGLIGSLIGCFAGLAIVDLAIFSHTMPLDKARWRRFLNGGVLGYWISYVGLLYLLGSITWDVSAEWALAVLPHAPFAGAGLIGAALGFINVARNDAADRAEAANRLLLWQQARAAPVVEPANPGSAASAPSQDPPAPPGEGVG